LRVRLNHVTNPQMQINKLCFITYYSKCYGHFCDHNQGVIQEPSDIHSAVGSHSPHAGRESYTGTEAHPLLHKEARNRLTEKL